MAIKESGERHDAPRTGGFSGEEDCPAPPFSHGTYLPEEGGGVLRLLEIQLTPIRKQFVLDFWGDLCA